MLDRVLEFKPKTWTYADYSNKRYVLVEVDSSSDEYSEITAPFGSYTIEKVERIQNPYALGCYLIRKEQLTARSYSTVYEMKCYHPLEKQDYKTDALEYNLDVRRYSALAYNTQPQFYTNIVDIINKYRTFIICKMLSTSQFSPFSYMVEPKYESEYLPEYVVKL